MKSKPDYAIPTGDGETVEVSNGKPEILEEAIVAYDENARGHLLAELRDK